ncbi:MAG: hypothetical protein ACOYIP_02950 [Coriobacteriales bacterium]|jgi:hypothetical protein
MDEYIRHDDGIEDEDALGYESADASRVIERAGNEAKQADDSDWFAEPDLGAAEARKFGDKNVDVKKAAGAAGAAAVLVATLGSASIDTDQVRLPDPVPIVQTLDLGSGAPVADAADAVDASDEKRSSAWEWFLKILKYLIVIIAAIVALVFGLIKGCASCAAPVPGPDDDQKQEQACLSGEYDMQATLRFDECMYSL